MNLTYENCITLLALVDSKKQDVKEMLEFNGPHKDYWTKELKELEHIRGELYTKACELVKESA